MEQKLEWKIDSEWSQGRRWLLCNSANNIVGRVVRFGTVYLGGLDGTCDGPDLQCATMKEAAQYVVAEYKAWRAKNQSSTGTDAK